MIVYYVLGNDVEYRELYFNETCIYYLLWYL